MTCDERYGIINVEVQEEVFKVGWLTVKFPNMGVRLK